MPESKLIPTRTNLLVEQGGTIMTISTEFDPQDGCAAIQAFIAADDVISNGISVKQGEGAVIIITGLPNTPTLYLNELGELIVQATDSENYSINDNGDLVVICES